MKQQKPGRAGVGAGEVFVEITEKKRFPGFRFSGGWKLALGRGKRRLQENETAFRRIKTWGFVIC
jgi:hypothetical protein